MESSFHTINYIFDKYSVEVKLTERLATEDGRFSQSEHKMQEKRKLLKALRRSYLDTPGFTPKEVIESETYMNKFLRPLSVLNALARSVNAVRRGII